MIPKEIEEKIEAACQEYLAGHTPMTHAWKHSAYHEGARYGFELALQMIMTGPGYWCQNCGQYRLEFLHNDDSLGDEGEK